VPARSRSRSRRAGKRRLVLLSIAIALIAVGGILATRGGGDHYPAPGDKKLHALVERIAAVWRPHQSKRDGRYLDPVNGIAASGYGSGMIGYAQLTSPDKEAQRQGFRAIRFALSEPPGMRGVFDQLIIARAYNWSRKHLSHQKAFKDLRDEWRSNLKRTADVAFFRPGAAVTCFKDPACYSNHEMVEAAADIELLSTGLEGDGAKAKLRDRDALRARALKTIELAGRSAGSAAYSDSQRGLGLLSDTGPYPLGYHVLSAAILAMAVDRLGDDAPEAAREELRRALDTMVGFMGPDGDLAYVGARYEQVWVEAAAAYAARAGAKVLGSGSAEGQRYEAAGQRALGRLRRLYPLEASGLRVGTRPLADTYRGIDGAQIPSNGLALLFLREASRIKPGPQAKQIPADVQGHTFVDPAHARIAVRRSGELWWAVRARPRLPVDPHRDPDQRFDFGVMDLKVRTAGGGWRDLIEPRPRTIDLGIHSSGPVMLGPGGEVGYPWGDRIELRDGGVDIVGGFRVRDPENVSMPGRWLRQGVTFSYRPEGRSLVLTWNAAAGDRYEVMTWANGGRYRPAPGGIVVGPGQHTFSAAPPAWRVGERQSGCCALDVRPVTGTIMAPAAGPLTWRIGPN
jgi:hypothetical protein